MKEVSAVMTGFIHRKRMPENLHNPGEYRRPVRRRLLIAAITLTAVVIALSTVAAYAFFSGHTQDITNTVPLGYAGVEVWEEGGQEYVIRYDAQQEEYIPIDKSPQVKNTGTVPVWVRVTVAGGLDKFEQILYNASAHPDGFWIDGEDGYWYYSMPLEVGKVTGTPLFNDLQLKTDADNLAELDIAVYAEGVQTRAGESAIEAFAALKAAPNE